MGASDLPRSANAAPSPSQRVIELTQQVARLSEDRDEALKAAGRYERDYHRWHSFAGTSFGGVPMAQFWCDLMLWEAVLNDRRDVRGIVEIGTWQGGLAWWLAAQAAARGIDFLTVDAVTPEGPFPPQFRRMDVWREKGVLLDVLHGWEPVVLFCDGGNKPRELREFGLALNHPRSLVFVHDWGTETKPEDVPDGLTMVYGDFCEQLGGVTRVFAPGQTKSPVPSSVLRPNGDFQG